MKYKMVFYPKDIYGRRLYYPVDLNAHLFCDEVVKSKSLTAAQIKAVRHLGYTVILVSDAPGGAIGEEEMPHKEADEKGDHRPSFSKRQ